MPLGWSVPTHIQARACQPNLPHKLGGCCSNRTNLHARSMSWTSNLCPLVPTTTSKLGGLSRTRTSQHLFVTEIGFPITLKPKNLVHLTGIKPVCVWLQIQLAMSIQRKNVMVTSSIATQTCSRFCLAVPRGNDPLLYAWQAYVRPWTLWDQIRTSYWFPHQPLIERLLCPSFLSGICVQKDNCLSESGFPR